MNPIRWNLEQQIELWLAIFSGAALSVVVGYFIYLAASGVQASAFGHWVLYFGFWWGVFGGIVGAGALYFLEKI